LAARLSAVDIQTRRITASVLLVKALGGDWHAAAAPATSSSASQ
jgi:outer membrane protein TolC